MERPPICVVGICAMPLSTVRFFAHGDFRAVNLQGAHLWSANLQGARLRDANLVGAGLRYANLVDAGL